MKKIKMTENDLRLLLLLVSLLLLAGSYFFFYRPKLSQAESLRISNAEKDSRVKELQGMLLRKQEEMERTEAMRQEIEEIKKVFPAGLTEEKAIYIMEQMEKEAGMEITSLSFQMESPYFTGDGVEIAGMVSQISLSFDKAPYKGIKKACDFINTYSDRMTIENLTCSYNETEQKLTGSMTINLYAMQGTGKVYEPPVIQSIPKGVKNIFRSGK